MTSVRSVNLAAWISFGNWFWPSRRRQVFCAPSTSLNTMASAQLGERHDAVPVERGLEREVEAGEGLDGGEPRHDEGHLHAPALTQSELLGEQGVDGFQRVHFAALDPAHRGVEDFDGAWHFQTNQAPLDAVDDGEDDLGMRGHRVLSWPARRRPTAS